MGFPWRKLANVGIGVASIFVPGLQGAIHTVEEQLPGLKGDQKKAAAIAIAQTIVATAEGAASKDLVNDTAVMSATSNFVDAYVALQNAIAAAKAAH